MHPDISLVVPLYNEAPNLDALYAEVVDSLCTWGRPYELILVDDGSTDESFEILAGIQARDPRVRVIRFRRNFGQTAAFAAGFDAARGQVVVTLDGDLQNDPRDIPALVDQMEASGLDLVCGWRKHRKDAWLNRRLPAKLANGLISRVTGVRLRDYGCSLKAFRIEVVREMRLYGELHRFLPALAHAAGARIAQVPVNHRPRIHGRSKYGISRTIRVVLDLMAVKVLLGYRTRPLHVFGTVGGALGLAGVGLLAVLGALWAVGGASGDAWHPGLFLLALLLVFSALHLVALGLLAEMQVRTYHESQGKPIYVIRQVLEFTPEQPAVAN